MSIKGHHKVTVITLVLLSVSYSNYCLTTMVSIDRYTHVLITDKTTVAWK